MMMDLIMNAMIRIISIGLSLELYLVKRLSEKDYEGAIRLYNDRVEYQNFLQPDEFQKLIRNQIEKYIDQHTNKHNPFYLLDKPPNDEQKDIIADMSQYLLVQARA